MTHPSHFIHPFRTKSPLTSTLVRSAFLVLFVLASAGTAFLQGSGSAPGTVTADEARKWREDLRVLAAELPKQHGNLYHKTSKATFDAAVARLDERIPSLARHEIVVELARIVALANDGHTNVNGLLSSPTIGFRAYPVLLYAFKDGLFVQAADRRYADVVGGRVVTIGNATADEALAKAGEIVFHDNAMGIKTFAPYLLTTPEILDALGIVDDMERAELVVEKDGRRVAVELTPTARAAPSGHLGLPISGGDGWIDMRDGASAPTPLWLKQPENLYWFELLEDSHTLYVQYNAVQNRQDESIAAFAARLSAFIEGHPVERLVLDLRWNGGGNNYLNKPLLLAILKSKIDERGKLYVVIGRRTFSAAQNFVNELEKYTNATFVGEPTAENVNFYGDARRFTLPNSGIAVQASTLWWQNMDPRDRREWTAPKLAAELTSADYRANVDPALRVILENPDQRDLSELVLEALDRKDAKLAAERFRAYLEDPVHAYANVESEMNALGYRLLGENRTDAAVEVFKLNVEAYPQSSNAYDSLGEGYMKAGKRQLAIENYEMSLKLNPENAGGAEMLKRLRAKE